MEQKEKNNSKNKIVITILIMLLLGLLAYMFYNNTELQKSKAFLEDEKVKIEQDLDDMIARYDTAIGENSSLSEELKLEREDIVMFRDSVKNLKQTNYNIIRRYRKKIKSLENSNAQLFKVNDSLRISNQFLANEIDSARVFIQSQTAQLDTLNIQNSELIERIGVGAQLHVNSVKAVSMKERSSGKLVATSRASRTDALRISFRIAENDLAEARVENVLIQVLNPKGEVVHAVGEESIDNGGSIIYTDKTAVEYAKENIDVISLIEVNRKEMIKGTHIVKVYLNGQIVGISKFSLK
ncbi:MAG: hypothetical protein L3J14_02940 [Flavobacteriaceae bacterium]|nr:hypothetical protein [Flavobacteriaceae bacterium]